ncbi:alkaline phosphatase D family protein [Actinomadura sp. 9N215]|uniref:alkaline phosphatase D family protein n=1 Tax=Actinomadura sp. 9N215 TaxID=3375150 RepID=UPI0037AE2A71
MVALSRLTPDPAQASPRLAGYPFTFGVASGDPWPDGVVLWTRLATTPLADDGLGGMPGKDVPVRWEVAEDDAMRRVVKRGSVLAAPELAHSVHVEVKGLRPGREYWYRFSAGGEESPIGRTRTAPDPSAAVPFTLAFASCQQWVDGFYTVYRHMAAQDLDVIFHLGDYIYEGAYGPTGGARNTPLSAAHNARLFTLAQYRLRYSLTNSDPDLQAAHRIAPWIVTPDDHEIINDWADESVPGISPENVLRMRAAGFRAYYENLPLRPSSMPQGPDMQIFRRFRYGRLASFFVLDGRQYRSAQDFARRFDADRSMLGSGQERWLLDGLGRSRTTWNMLANQVEMYQQNRFTADGGIEQFHPDIWDGYEAARRRLFGGIQRRRVANPVVITGDAHWSAAADLKADFNDQGSPTIGVEFMGTSITSGGNGVDMTEGSRLQLRANPHLKFVNNLRGYVACRVAAKTWETDYNVISKITDQSGVVSVRRRFAVEAGRPGLQDAGAGAGA